MMPLRPPPGHGPYAARLTLRDIAAALIVGAVVTYFAWLLGWTA